MQNAHLRMGRQSSPPRRAAIRLASASACRWTRAIVEAAGDRDSCARCHMFSVVGGDQDVCCRYLPRSRREQSEFTIEGPDGPRVVVTPGENAKAFRSSLTIPDRKHAVRHLVAVSEELSLTQAGANPEAKRTVLCDDDTRFILYRLGIRFGLPVLPEWSEWVIAELQHRRVLTPLIGLGCRPILVNATKASLLNLVSTGLKRSWLTISERGSTPQWNLPGQFLAAEPETAPCVPAE